MSNDKTLTLRLPGEDLDRAEALIDALRSDPRLRAARIGRSYVLRLALDLGLGVLERDHATDAPSPRPTPKPSAPAPKAPRKAAEPDSSALPSTYMREYKRRPSRLSKPATEAAARLRAWRMGEGLNQTAAGKLIGVAQNTLSSLETGKRPPTAEVAAKIEELAGIPADAWTEEG